MHAALNCGRRFLHCYAVAGALLLGAILSSAGATNEPEGRIRIVKLQGTVEIIRAGTSVGVFTHTTNQPPLMPGDRLRTGANSGVSLSFSDNSIVTAGAYADVEITSPEASKTGFVITLWKGLLYFFHRGEPGKARIVTAGAPAGIEGTEVVIEVATVDNREQTVISVIDGKVRFGEGGDALLLSNGESAIARRGERPARAPGFVVNNVLQWAFYYPGILDLRDLSLTAEDVKTLAESLSAYKAGDLLAALAKYPSERKPSSQNERIYHAALLLAVGQVQQAHEELAALSGESAGNVSRLASAVRQVIAAVKRETMQARSEPQLPTELLAASYYEQSRALGDDSLKAALKLARRAATTSPEFGFAWARVAELELSFGHRERAKEALEKALALSPRNAQAMATEGFILATENRPKQALEKFEAAIAIDSGLANAWVGRGLTRIRRGNLKDGRHDLLVAAALEPQRAVLRSYLTKAFAEDGDRSRARHEIELARILDENDPTAWLYSALVNEQYNRINEGIRDLEKSQELNDNRRLYRSKLLLDQDRAIGSANLARLYADAGLGDVAVREAGRGVAAAYADYSSHVFLANSYEIQRRDNLSNLRFESAAISETLVANLLGPADGRLLAQSLSPLENSKLFERDRLGVYADTEYFSRGAWRHSSAQFGTYQGLSYSLEAEYRTDPGERINQDLEIRQLEAKVKQDITPDDSLYFHIIDYRSNGGDNSQHFDESEIAPAFRFDSRSTPALLAGYHHQWAPGNHTLLLAGRFEDTLNTALPNAGAFVVDLGFGANNGLYPVNLNQHYRSKVLLYTAEAQQILTTGPNTLILGAAGQLARQRITNQADTAAGFYFYLLGFPDPVTVQPGEELDSWAGSVYAYDYFQVLDSLQVIGGINYTRQKIPVSAVISPISSTTEDMDQVNPKAGLIWTPHPITSLRATYSRSLAGASFGQSVRLEPTHIAGLLQTFRNPAPPSILGELDGAEVETVEGLWELHFRDTYFSVAGQRLSANRDRQFGLYLSSDDYVAGPTTGLLREDVDFREHALDISAHQLLGDGFSVGARYRLAYADLRRNFPDFPNLGFGDLPDSSQTKGWLHTVRLDGIYRHHTGVFTRAEGIFFAQDREQDGANLASDDLWQINLFAGYRFPRNHAEITVGVLNLLNEDYRLDPINPYAELPRTRTVYARLILSF